MSYPIRPILATILAMAIVYNYIPIYSNGTIGVALIQVLYGIFVLIVSDIIILLFYNIYLLIYFYILYINSNVKKDLN